MGDDAHQQSQAAQDTPRAAELRQFVEELAARLEAMEAQRGRAQRMADLLDGAAGPEPPSRRRPKRDRHGLHVVRGLAAGAAGWLARSWARRAFASAATVALVTGGAGLTTDMMQPAPAAQLPDFGGHHHHHQARHHDRQVPVFGLMAPGRRRRRGDMDADDALRAGAHASRPGTPSPSPQATTPSPVPSPLPSVTVPPLPSPTCTHLTGKHCHDDGAGDVPIAGVAPQGLAGQP